MNSTALVPTTGAHGVPASSDVASSLRETPRTKSVTPLEQDKAAAAIVRGPLQSYPGRGIGVVHTAASTSYFVATDSGVVKVGDAGIEGIEQGGRSHIVCNNSDTTSILRTLAANHAAHRRGSLITVTGSSERTVTSSGDFRIICCGRISATNVSVALAVPTAIHDAIAPKNTVGITPDRIGFGEVFLGPENGMRAQSTIFSVSSRPIPPHNSSTFQPSNRSELFRYSTPAGDLTAYSDLRNPSQVAYWWTDAGKPPGSARLVQMHEPLTAA